MSQVFPPYNLTNGPTMSFIETTTEKCSCCDDDMTMYHIPLPLEDVTFDAEDGFCLHLNQEEMQTLYLEIKEHMMGLHDVEPVA